MALLGLLALLAHGGDAAVSVYTPRGPTGLRAAQECADLGSWLAYLGAGACADLGVDAAVCADLAKPDRANARCVETHGPAASKALGDAKRRHEKELWKGTAAFTISAFNNWGVERYPATDLRLESLDDVTKTMAYDARELAFRYDLKCFNTAVKPHVFRMLFGRGYRSVLYFDPDIHFYADFDEVLTPRGETPDDGEWQTDLQIMRAGVYNYGFLGLSNAYPDVLDHYLAWWAEALRYQGGVDLEAGLHFDQNWAVFVPSFYPEKTYKVLVDPRYNAAYWNLHYRGAEIAYTSDSGVTYGAPLVFFHFSGVSTDVINFDAISPHQTRYSLGDLPNLRPLLASYWRR
ncbi:glycosyl transferase [Aureococcus anophagefferens]|nr:glycosyl transferase [Aureococcus anophagefferens]